jgi:hypothetical protein
MKQKQAAEIAKASIMPLCRRPVSWANAYFDMNLPGV